MLQPLNGTRTHPLSDHARQMLRYLSDSPMPRQQINAGVCNRLLRESLVESVMLPSPYAKHRGANIEFFKITEAGKAVLAEKS